jgi:hypothetical protein
VLTSNGYMRLDPNAMHWPIYSAGRLLAGLGRQEALNCIDGLNQNGYAYDGTFDYFAVIHGTAIINKKGSIEQSPGPMQKNCKPCTMLPWPKVVEHEVSNL